MPIICCIIFPNQEVIFGLGLIIGLIYSREGWREALSTSDLAFQIVLPLWLPPFPSLPLQNV